MKNSENVLAIHIGKLVKQYRKELHLTQDDVAQMLNVHKSRVSWIERGLSLPQIGTLLSISKILKLPPTKFLFECFNVMDLDNLDVQKSNASFTNNEAAHGVTSIDSDFYRLADRDLVLN